MNREEILEKSRKENKDQDIYEKEILLHANSIASVVAIGLSSIFFIVQILVGKGINYGLYAVMFSLFMTSFWCKWVKLHRKHELFVAICYTVMVAMLSFAHIYQLVTM